MSQVAARAFTILEHVARSDEPLGLMEVATRLEADKSAALRTLAFLEGRGMLRRDTETKKYRIGPSLLSLAAIAIRRADLPHVAQPYLTRLRDLTGETVSLHVRVGDERVCIAGAESPQVIQRVLTIGEPVSLVLGPSGKVILASLAEEARSGIVARAGASPARLERDLRRARRDGYLIVTSDRTPGVGAISAPIRDAGGAVGSITIAGPEERWSPAAMRRVVPALLDAAAAVSTEIGGS
jgi:IclR family transcriptional regulator, acetate operon repressor